MIGAAIGQIVARHGGDDDMIEAHAAGGFSDAGGLIEFQRKRFCGSDGAESASAGAAVAGDHEGGGSFAPAFPMVGAFGAFADGVKPEVLEEVSGLSESIAG